LKDHDYQIRAITDGTTYHGWFPYVNLLVTKVNNLLEWVRFKTNQVIYVPTAGDTKEPKLPPIDKGIFLYLDPRNLNKGQLVEFLENAKYRWNIWTEHKPVFQQQIKLDEEEE
jgi:hypothetical protein